MMSLVSLSNWNLFVEACMVVKSPHRYLPSCLYHSPWHFYIFRCCFQNIIHRDIKPENILCPQSFKHGKGVKLADFGMSIDFAEERPVSRVGTLDYMVRRLTFKWWHACWIMRWEVLTHACHAQKFYKQLVWTNNMNVLWLLDQAPEILVCPDKHLPEDGKNDPNIGYTMQVSTEVERRPMNMHQNSFDIHMLWKGQIKQWI